MSAPVSDSEPTVGFIILRHVNSSVTNMYWKLSYTSIRKFFPENHIIIIDDNSNTVFLDKEHEKTLYKTTVIQSEYPARGELLPYYYYLKNKLFDTAVIIHDSVFINSKIDTAVNKYKIMWEFEHDWDRPIDEIQLIRSLDNHRDLLEFYIKKNQWKGCFGGMSIITHDYLTEINNKYNISNLIPHVKTRQIRMAFERVIASLLQVGHPKECLLGNIHKYCPWGITINHIDHFKHLPVIKVWSGR